MSVVIITGSCGLTGPEAARHLARRGYYAMAADSEMRAKFFGPSGSAAWNRSLLDRDVGTTSRSRTSTPTSYHDPERKVNFTVATILSASMRKAPSAGGEGDQQR